MPFLWDCFLIYVSKGACFQEWLMGGMYHLFGGAGIMGRSKAGALVTAPQKNCPLYCSLSTKSKTSH